MGFLTKLFGSESIIKGVYNGTDKAFFTSEEKADHFLKLMKAYEPFKLLQRFLALIVGIPYIIVYLISAFFFMYGMTLDDIEKSMRLVQASKELAAINNNTLGTPFAIILSFAFGGGLLEGGIRAFKDKGK